MSAVASAIEDVVGGAVEAVGDVVEDVGNFVVDEIVQPIATTVEKTVNAALEDPIGTAAMVATAIYAPYLLPATSAANTLAKGGDINDALESAAIAYVGGKVGAEVGGYTGSNIAAGSATGATSAALRGGDIEQGIIMGGLSGGAKDLSQAISDQQFEDWSQGQAAQADDNMVWPTEQDVLAADPSIPMDFPLSTPTDATGPGYYNELEGNYIESDIGGLQRPLDDTSGTNVDSMAGYSTDPNTQITTGPNGQEYDLSNLPKPSYESVSGSDLVEPPSGNWSEEGYDPLLGKKDIEQGLKFAANALLADDQQKARLARIKANGACVAMGGFDMNIPWLSTQEQMLHNKIPVGCSSTTNSGASPSDLSKIYANLNPELATEFADRGIGANILKAQTPTIRGLGFEGTGTYATGGTTSCTKSSEFCSTWGAMGQFMPKFYSQSNKGMMPGLGGKRQAPALAQLKHMYGGISQQGNMGGMAKGGLPSKYQEAAPEGHNPEFITGLTGYYACGGGTGQSDDITAMLHDGDYVMDAETVSALGDGSSKAGRAVLEGFQAKVPHRDGAEGKPVPAKIADGEYVFPSSFVTALGRGDNKAGAKILDGLREKLRAHKRSAPDSKIPPKAKSPLDYIKGSKG